MSEFISHKKLLEILDYNKETGVFIWKIKTGIRVKVGNKAGWYDKSTGYESIKIDGKTYKSHKLAWFYVNKKKAIEIDHINHVKNDNRIYNLREVTHQENQKNKTLFTNNTSGVCGVYFHKKHKKWTANIKVNTKQQHLGMFTNIEDAIIARKKAELKYDFHENHGRNLIKEATQI